MFDKHSRRIMFAGYEEKVITFDARVSREASQSCVPFVAGCLLQGPSKEA